MLDQIKADQDNDANGSFESVTTNDETTEFVCCSFRINRDLWNACKNGGVDDMAGFFAWIEQAAK